MTDPYHHVLLATEGTEFDAGAERLGIGLAATLRVPLMAVLPVVSNSEVVVVAPDLEEKAEVEAAAKMDRLRKAAHACEVQVDGKVRLGGNPGQEIVDDAKERAADLIVLRRRGKKGYLANVLVGEMVHSVASQSPCDVLVVPRSAAMWSHGIVFATDCAASSERAAAVASAVAVQFGLPVTAVSVLPKRNGDESAAIADMERVVEKMRASGVNATGRIVEGKPHEAILQVAQETGADLIVTGRRGLNRVERMFRGSTSEAVAGYANVPVLIVQSSTNSHAAVAPRMR